MHLIAILLSLSFGCWLRLWADIGSPEKSPSPCQQASQKSWSQRWQRTLTLFLLPPCLILLTAFSVVCMGPQGQMIGFQVSSFSYWLAVSFLICAAMIGIQQGWQVWQSWQQMRSCPQLTLMGRPIRLLEVPILFAAQVGLWHSEIAISQGLLDALDEEHLAAVVQHEQAHQHYRDTFWFFWLAWLRQLTQWLPNTAALWQELLLLRELRADCWAAQTVDNLLLAESLLAMVASPAPAEKFCVAFSCPVSRSRFQERIDALLSAAEVPPAPRIWSLAWLVLALLPLATLPLHR